MEPIEIIGILSAIFALVAFVGNQYHKLADTSIIYDGLNLASGLGLVFYAYTIGAVPFMITNSVWALVSGIDVVRFLAGKGRLKKRRK